MPRSGEEDNDRMPDVVGEVDQLLTTLERNRERIQALEETVQQLRMELWNKQEMDDILIDQLRHVASILLRGREPNPPGVCTQTTPTIELEEAVGPEAEDSGRRSRSRSPAR